MDHTWDKPVPAAQQFYGDRIKRPMPFCNWIEAAEKSEEKKGVVRIVLAVKLPDTYKAWNRS